MSTRPHDFVVVVPVADRPRQLATCLASLEALLRAHPYRGEVSLLVIDDSRAPAHVAQHKRLVEDFGRAGLATQHLTPAAQRALVRALPSALRARLKGVLGDADAPQFTHKGAAITRNIAYLWLARLPRDGRRRLFWFVDSDEAFQVEVAAGPGQDALQTLPYLQTLDRIFSDTDTAVLTGKVVGDPPVSPAVMAGTFLDDVLGFLTSLAASRAQAPCGFHGPVERAAKGAAYHDMAELFGFAPAQAAFRYPCPLAEPHDQAACLADFAARLDRFFDGEHPTRRSVYAPDDGQLLPARTLYTGNYVFRPALLEQFIPFASLRLRMAGPTLGRLLRAELGSRFVSANLPLQHTRTLEALGQSECRPGVARQAQGVDLSDEFERQYFGDVLLFAMEQLTEQGYPAAAMPLAEVEAVLAASEADLYARYRTKQAEVNAKIARLAARFGAESAWWSHAPDLEQARRAFHQFIADMSANFGPDARIWQRLGDPEHRRRRLSELAAAIVRYPAERHAWREALSGP